MGKKSPARLCPQSLFALSFQQVSDTPGLVDFSSIPGLPPHNPDNIEICVTSLTSHFIIDGVLYASGAGNYSGLGETTPDSFIPVVVDSNNVSDLRCINAEFMIATPMICAKFDGVLKWCV